MKKIFIVPYCHPDWAWTFTRRWHEKRYVLVFEEVLDILKKNRDFRWYMDEYITELEPFLRFRPERYKELARRVAEGKIAICGTFTNLRPTMVGEETQIRNIIIGKGKYRKLFPQAELPVYASNVDVSLGHPQMPQILTLSGYEYFRFWRPHAALSAKKVPLEFFWQGFDGSKILCSRGCYGGYAWRGNIYKDIEKEINYNRELSPTGVRWISHGADDARPLRTTYEDKRIPIAELIKKWNRKERIPLRFGTPLEFFKELKKYRAEIPVLKGSLDPCDVSYNIGWGGSRGLFYLRQQNEINLTEAEKWASIGSRFGYKYPAENIRQLWQYHLITCAHATQWLFEEDFKEILKLAQRVKYESGDIKREALNHLKKFVPARENSEVIIFNSLPFQREEKIAFTISFPKSVQKFGLIDGDNRKIPFQASDKNEKANKVWEYKILAKVKLPPCGYNTVSITKRKPPVKIKTVPFRVDFQGSDLTLVKIDGQRYAITKENSFGNLKLYRVDTRKGFLHVGPILGQERVRWRKTETEEDGEIYSRYRSTGGVGDHSVIRDIIVYKDESRIELRLEVDWAKEDGFLTLEWPRIFKGKIYGDFPFGVEEKDIEKEPYGKLSGLGFDNVERQRKNLFFAKSFLNYTDGKRSISYLNYDATHYYILFKKSIGNILLNSVTHRPGWERFINRNAAAEGRHTFLSHIIFHPGDWRKVNLPKKAQSLLIKPEKIFVDRALPGKLRRAQSLLSISPANLIMTGFYKEGRYTVLRFYESQGRKTKAQIKLPFPAREIRKIDLRGKPLSDIRQGETITFEVNPWEITTLKLHEEENEIKKIIDEISL